MTITFSGVFGITQPTEPTDLGMFRVTGRQSGTFSFIPDDPSQPTISGTFRFRLAGNAKTDIDTIDFAFIMLGRAQDGSIFRFIQHERAVVGQEGLNISFGKTDGVGMPRDN